MSSVLHTPQYAVEQCIYILWISGGRENNVRVGNFGVREKFGEFGLEVDIVKQLVRRLDSRSRIRAHQRPWCILYSVSARRHLECLPQGVVLPLREENCSILMSDKKREDI